MTHQYPRPKRDKHKSQFEVKSLFKQPDKTFYRMPEMEMSGGRIMAEGCRQILEYSSDKLCVDFGRTVTTFYGKCIKIELLAGKRIVITGQMQSIVMSGTGGGEGDAPSKL